MLQPRSLESLAPRLVGRDGKPLVKNGVIDQQAVDDYLSEEELLDGADDEADMSILPQEVTNSPHGHRIAQTRLLFQELMIGGGGEFGCIPYRYLYASFGMVVSPPAHVLEVI